MSQEYARVPTEEPPSYDTPRVAGDNIPDDFKYSVDVASCELPIRQLFIRKVYSLLAIQILGTVLVGFIIRSSPSIKEWCFSNMWLFAITMIGSIGFLVATHFKARSYPTNLFLLGGFTLCEASLLDRFMLRLCRVRHPHTSLVAYILHLHRFDVVCFPDQIRLHQLARYSRYGFVGFNRLGSCYDILPWTFKDN